MRALWAAVVLQARDDLDLEPYGSTVFSQAYSFFFSRGDWTLSRQTIADCLDLHIDDLTRLGRLVLQARQVRDGGIPRPTAAEPPAPQIAIPATENRDRAPDRTEAQPTRKPRRLPVQHTRQWWIDKFMAKHAA